jgi:hypothetical protein
VVKGKQQEQLSVVLRTDWATATNVPGQRAILALVSKLR